MRIRNGEKTNTQSIQSLFFSLFKNNCYELLLFAKVFDAWLAIDVAVQYCNKRAGKPELKHSVQRGILTQKKSPTLTKDFVCFLDNFGSPRVI